MGNHVYPRPEHLHVPTQAPWAWGWCIEYAQANWNHYGPGYFHVPAQTRWTRGWCFEFIIFKTHTQIKMCANVPWVLTQRRVHSHTWTTTSARRARISARKLGRSTARILPGVSGTSSSNVWTRSPTICPTISQAPKRNNFRCNPGYG